MKSEFEPVFEAIRRAGEEVLRIYKENIEVALKEDNSPITEADSGAQDILLGSLDRFGYGVLSEEQADSEDRFSKDRVWIVDPLDGTRDFIGHNGEFSIMVGLAEKGESVFGAVYQPTENRMYWAEKGKGAFMENGDGTWRLSVSLKDSFSQARFVVSRNHFAKEEKEFFEREGIKSFTHMGSAGLKVGLIAEGKAEAYIALNSYMKEWDICAPDIILREAGGKLTDAKGNTMTYNKQDVRNYNGLVASNAALHKDLIKQLSII